MQNKKETNKRSVKNYWKLPEDAGKIPLNALRELEIACKMLGMNTKWLHSK